MRKILCFFLFCISSVIAWAQNADVQILEQRGNNGSICVFSVSTPVKAIKMSTVDGTAKLEPEEQACREVMYSILFDGVENYNGGAPLVGNLNDPFAKSLINPKSKSFMTYFKEVQLENSTKDKQLAFHYIVELNNFNLLRLLKMRGSIK